jgi:serine protease DegQ
MRWRFALALVCGLLPAAPLWAGDKAEVPYKLTATNHVMVRVKINGKGPFNLILDTGAPAVFVTKAVAKKAKIDIDNKGWGNPDSFQIEGGLTVPAARVRVEDLFQLDGMNGMGLAGVELHGVIGYNVLAKYKVEYDFTADKIGFEYLPDFTPPALEPIAGGKTAGGGLEALGPMMKMMASMMGIKPNFATVPRGFVGVEIDDADGVVVRKVLPGSPADKAGLKVGDKLESVKSVSIDGSRDLARALAKAGVGSKIKVEVKRGGKAEELTIVLGGGL